MSDYIERDDLALTFEAARWFAPSTVDWLRAEIEAAIAHGEDVLLPPETAASWLKFFADVERVLAHWQAQVVDEGEYEGRAYRLCRQCGRDLVCVAHMRDCWVRPLLEWQSQTAVRS